MGVGIVSGRMGIVDRHICTHSLSHKGIGNKIGQQLFPLGFVQLFDVDRSVITKHLKNIYDSGELSQESTCAKFAQVADNGKTYHYKLYSLETIIAVGYRINSERATQFRQWATKVLNTFTKQGYVLDKSRLVNG